MKTVDVRWENLATGLSRAEQLERELKKEWVPRMEEAGRKRLERERAAWQGRREVEQRRFEKQLAAWRQRYAERCRDVEERLPGWTQACADERRRLAARTRSGTLYALAALAVGAGFLALLAAPTWSYVVAVIVALSSTLGPAALSGWRLRRLRTEKPSPDHADDPEPRPPAGEPEPQPAHRPPLHLDIAQQWWDQVSYDPDARRLTAAHGDEGMDDFWRDLSAQLPDDHVAVRDLLVSRSLDADVIVVAPNGIWIFEVKHWSGEITCRQGRWSRRRTWYEAGGYEASEDREIDSFDQQWLREEKAVKETLQRRLPQPGPFVAAINGGIVFTHPGATLDIDQSCRSGWGPPEHWVRTIRNSPPLPQLASQERLRALAALLKWAHRLDRDPNRTASCCVELAERLFSKAAGDARAYVEA